ncbi:hypothetical protein TNCV_4778371 [Trichonephila clavipes]|nr:hypothetical protein TNCV_4778371 [Trichonephila clavipes]
MFMYVDRYNVLTKPIGYENKKRPIPIGVLPTLGKMECNRLESVVFSEKSGFSLRDDAQRIRVCWQPDHRSNPHLLSRSIQ